MNSPETMDFFEIEIDEKSRVGSEFMARIVNEIRKAVAEEKSKRKLTQQNIADAIGTSRAVINRQVQGYENLTARRIAELLWAIGWEPHFEARPIPAGDNQIIPPSGHAPLDIPRQNSKAEISALDEKRPDDKDKERGQKPKSAAELAYAE